MFNSLKTWGAAVTLAVCAVSGANAITPVTAVQETNPDAIVKGAVDNSFEILKKYNSNRSTSNQALVTDIKENVLTYFNTKYIAASILGSYYRSATPAQFQEFTATIEDYMVNAYIEGLDFYHGQKVQQDPSRNVTPDGRFAQATVTVFDRNPIPVTFNLLKRNDGKYRIVDFNALGISIVQTKTAEWQPILRTQGVVGLTKYVKANTTNILGSYKKAN